MKRLAHLLLDYFRHAAGFLVASAGVAAVVTFALPFIGYETFGDRPGPGWYGPPAHLTWQAVGELAQYALALPLFGAVGVAVYLLLPFLLVRILEERKVPRLLVQLVGGLLGAVVAFLVIAGAGWYISLGAVAGGAGVLGGALYGTLRLPWRGDAPRRAAVDPVSSA